MATVMRVLLVAVCVKRVSEQRSAVFHVSWIDNNVCVGKVGVRNRGALWTGAS